jgi:hypothetical protein
MRCQKFIAVFSQNYHFAVGPHTRNRISVAFTAPPYKLSVVFVIHKPLSTFEWLILRARENILIEQIVCNSLCGAHSELHV